MLEHHCLANVQSTFPAQLGSMRPSEPSISVLRAKPLVGSRGKTEEAPGILRYVKPENR